jgi:hypothetical protein
VAKSERDIKGSVISINAREAHGDLRIAMVGANGRKGMPGAERELTMKDAPSRIAAAPLAAAHGADGMQSRGSLASGGGVGRDGFDNARSANPSVCTKQPGNGLAGAKGHIGIQGGKGEQGGNAGMLILNIEDSKDLRVEVRQKKGTPGKGGDGGPGFPGGLGGLPGKKPDSCDAAVAGAQGLPGDTGLPGGGGDEGDSANIPRSSTPVSILEL